jgi:hypothetical protein
MLCITKLEVFIGSLAPYLQLVLAQDTAFHHEDGGSHMQPEHPSLFRVIRKLNNDHKL